MSVSEGFAVLSKQPLSSEESRRLNDSREADMIATLALGPRRPDLSPKR